MSERARFVAPFAELRKRYGKQSAAICEAIEALGPHADASGLSREALRKKIWRLREETICLVGGYALIPPFVRENPTGASVPGFESLGDADAQVPTDAPYAADPRDEGGELLPLKSISRIPDGEPLDAAGFLKTLRWQGQAGSLPTAPGVFQGASDDLAAAARAIGKEIRASGQKSANTRPRASSGASRAATKELWLSPSQGDIGDPALTARLSRAGRVHLLLHGAARAPQWATLYGREPGGLPEHDTRALSAPLLDLIDARGSVAVLTSCYGAMLDGGDGATPARSAADQVALQLLGHGAKAVFGATRSNWIELTGERSFGPALSAFLWEELERGRPAATALREAKRRAHQEMIHGPRGDVAFWIKTLLQAHCYGHPLATLGAGRRS